VLDLGARLRAEGGREPGPGYRGPHCAGNKMFFIAKVAKMVLDGYLDKNPEGPDRDREKPVDIEATGNRAVLAEDKRSKEMAVALGLSAKTVETLRQQS
jgi:hypothetical protein